MALRFDENRKIAAVVLVVCILLSLFAFGGGALARERKKVLKVFNDGTDATLSVRHSMDAYLDSAAECAQIMAGEASIVLGDTQLTGDVSDASVDLAKDSSGIDARYEVYMKLKADVDKLEGQVRLATDEAGRRQFKLAYDDFWGYDDMIGHDDYPKYAKAYNELVSGFPGGAISGIMGLGALSTFGG